MIIDGRKIASEIFTEIKSEVAHLPFIPVFCDILVGSNRISAQYVSLKANKALSCGIKFLRAEFNENIKTAELILEIKKLNTTPDMCGLITQLPLPSSIDRTLVLDAIDPAIDVDCIGQKRNSEFYQGNLELVPPTASAVMQILDSLKIDLKEKNILVIGQGELVGKPVSFLLNQTRGLKVSTADKFTSNTNELISQADIVISGVGKPKLLTRDNIKPGSIIIDAGASEDSGEIVGDVDFESVKNIASQVSPVPGGVGPVTVAMLLLNVLKVAKKRLLG
ncbi:MAG: bifunctional 5,10-methylenetetrahydrofolate dehydrogenase/5,10-methenyltetrahydrofolate cyclohydrolase [Candidatus Doudnabacteria bacterium]|nr:bifunctional 5,10-methylenetetrahydrofolate dehydrogenase/5,10-methenyltetrahydrofolate cyclohydrolase [Candidatus Doudnabacteria bacterium]